MSITKAYRVWGADGHRQAVSFGSSQRLECSSPFDGTRIIEVFCSDITGTNDYTVIRITRDTEQQCEDEFRGQMSDGTFENSSTGKWMEISPEYSNIIPVNEYSYKQCLAAAMLGVTQPLADWFYAYDMNAWNGECFDLDDGSYLKPAGYVYDEDGDAEITGWELD